MKYAESNQEVGGLKMVLPRIHGNAMGIHPVHGSSLMGVLDDMSRQEHRWFEQVDFHKVYRKEPAWERGRG